MREEDYWLSFATCPGIGPVAFSQLLRTFSCAKDAWQASPAMLQDAGIGKKQIENFFDFRESFSIAQYKQTMAQKNIVFVIPNHGYPLLLQKITRPPIGLFVRGDSSILLEQNLIAIVGTRMITSYGHAITNMFAKELTQVGMIIVSGLALGVDATAHNACLDSGGKTIAVLGSGVDYATPRENQRLYDRILAQGGCIVSEYPLGQIPLRGSFPARNRIIAGMSCGVLVTEGATDSGSLITAREGLKNKRPVFAVPGPITSHVSAGPLSLITKGAQMVTNAGDILQTLGQNSPLSHRQAKRKGDTPEESKILLVLANENLSFDEIVKRTEISPVIIGSILTIMEMKSMIRTLDGGLFCLVDL